MIVVIEASVIGRLAKEGYNAFGSMYLSVIALDLTAAGLVDCDLCNCSSRRAQTNGWTDRLMDRQKLPNLPALWLIINCEVEKKTRALPEQRPWKPTEAGFLTPWPGSTYSITDPPAHHFASVNFNLDGLRISWRLQHIIPWLSILLGGQLKIVKKFYIYHFQPFLLDSDVLNATMGNNYGKLYCALISFGMTYLKAQNKLLYSLFMNFVFFLSSLDT